MIRNTSTQTVGRIALAGIAVFALALFAGLAAATVTVTEETVEVTDNETEEIVVDVELLSDADASNATVELTNNDTGELIEERSLNGTADEWDTEYFNVSEDGNYTVAVLADSEDDVGEVVVSVEGDDDGTFAAVPGGNSSLVFLGVVAVVAIGAVVYSREVGR